jgi:hypothetical protein
MEARDEELVRQLAALELQELQRHTMDLESAEHEGLRLLLSQLVV